MTGTTRQIDRRTFLRLTAGAVATGVVGTAVVSQALEGSPPETPSGEVVDLQSAEEALPPPERYLFQCATKRSDVMAQVTRMQAAWAHPEYTRFAVVTVSYVGPGSHELTPEEDEVVRVAEDNGASISDRPGYYRSLLSVATRVPPNRLKARLDELGVPGVKALQALAPFAPQAGRWQKWLDKELK